MSTTKTAIILLSILTLVLVVILSHYQLVTSNKRPQSNRSVSLAPALHQTVDSTPPTGTLTNVSQSYERFERIDFGTPVTSTNPRSTKACGNYQFQYVINAAQTCRNQLKSSVFLLNYVHSAVENLARRARVRASWARRSNYPAERVETVFFVGLPSGDRRRTTQAAVEAEFREYGDIVQVNIIDSYRYVKERSQVKQNMQ